ncbi:hypothetical protein HanPI659440_Chr16g0657991 [Helianthus annuus]|nr:hypothetical protein HanPI659440_Chr16g0657991 [Helianthus annuus]
MRLPQTQCLRIEATTNANQSLRIEATTNANDVYFRKVVWSKVLLFCYPI